MSEEIQQPVEEDTSTPKYDLMDTGEYVSIGDWKSYKIDKLAGALAKAQSEMGGVSKGKVNPFYKSNYADINSCIEACMPALNKHGLSISQGNRFCNTSGYYITTMLMHESGQWLRSEIRIPLTNKKDAQEIGSACTYGRRYGLTSMVGLAQVDDDGNATVNERKV